MITGAIMFKQTRKKLNFKANSVTFKNCDPESNKQVGFETLDHAWVAVEDVKRQIDMTDSNLQRSAKKKRKPERREEPVSDGTDDSDEFVPIPTDGDDDVFGTPRSEIRMVPVVINEPGTTSAVTPPNIRDNRLNFPSPNTPASPAIAQWVRVEPVLRKSVPIMSSGGTKKSEPSKSAAITHFICKPNNVHNSTCESNLACWESFQEGSPIVKRHVCALSSNDSSSTEKEVSTQSKQTLSNCQTSPITTTAPSLKLTSTASTTNTTTTKICAVIPSNSVPSYPGFCDVEKLSLAERQPWKHITAKMKGKKVNPPIALELESQPIQKKQTKSITPRTWREELKLLREENASKKSDKKELESEVKSLEEKLNEFNTLPEDVQTFGYSDILNEVKENNKECISEVVNVNKEFLSEVVTGNLVSVKPENKGIPLTATPSEMKILQNISAINSELSSTRLSPLTKKSKIKFIQGQNVSPECHRRENRPEKQETLKFISKQRKQRRELLKQEKERRAHLVEKKRKNLESLREQSLKIIKKSQQKAKFLKEYQSEAHSDKYEVSQPETVYVNNKIDLGNEIKTPPHTVKEQMLNNVENIQSDNVFSEESCSSNLCEQNLYIPNVKKPDIEYSERLKKIAEIVCKELETGILEDENEKYEVLNNDEELKLKKPSHSLLPSDSILSNRFEATDNEQYSGENSSPMREKYKNSRHNYTRKKDKDLKRINCYKWIRCINNYNTKKSFESSVNNVSESNIQNIPNVHVSQSHSPPIKLRERKSSLSDLLKEKMLHTDMTIGLLKEENSYYQHSKLKLDEIQKGNFNDNFIDVQNAAHLSTANQEEKHLLSANKIQPIHEGRKAQKSLNYLRKIETVSDPKILQQSDILQNKNEDQWLECVQKVPSNELEKDWLEPECLKPCPYTIMTAIKNKLAALKSHTEEKSINEISSKLHEKLEEKNSHSDPENQITHKSRKGQLEKIRTSSDIQNETYASSIESVIASPEVPKLNLPTSSSENDVPELEIPAVCLTRKRKCQKSLGEFHLGSSSKEMSSIVRDTRKKDIHAEVSKQTRSTSSSRRNSISENVEENIHDYETNVSNSSTFLHNLKDSIASVNTNLKVLSANITKRDEKNRSYGESIKNVKYRNNENPSVSYNENEEESIESSNIIHPTALHLQLQAGLNLLDSLDESRLRLAYIEGLHALNTAQQRTKKIALAFETQKVQHGNTIFSMEIKSEKERREMAENFDREREEYERILEKIEKNFKSPNFPDNSLQQRESPIKSSTDEIPSLNISQVSSFSNSHSIAENIERNETVGSASKVSLPVSVENNIQTNSEDLSARVAVNHSKSEIFTTMLPHNEQIHTSVSSILYEKLIEDEDIRVQEHLSLLDSREKDLLKFVTSKLKYFEDEKRKLLESGNKDLLPSIKKRQRNLILKLHKDRDEIRKLKTAYKTTLEARKELLLKHQSIVNAYESAENPSYKLKKRVKVIGDKKYQHMKTQDSPTKIIQAKYEVPGSSNSSSIKTEISKSSQKTSASNSAKLESATKHSDHSKRSSQPSTHGGFSKMSVSQEINLSPGCSKKEAAAQTSSPENRKILPSKWSLSDGEGWNHYDLLMWEKRLQEEDQRLKQPKAATQDRSTSPVLLEKNNGKDVGSADKTTDLSQRRSDNSSVPEDILAVSSRHSNSSIKSSLLPEEQYGTESLESPQSSEGVKNTSTTQSVTEIKEDCSPRNSSNIMSLYSSPNISLPKRFNDLKLKMNISPAYQGQQKRRYSSGSDESIIYSQTETPSEQSDLEGRISALKEQLRKRKMEAEKLRREQRRAHREMLKAKEQSLVNQIQALDNYIEKVKESLEQSLDTQLSPIVKPKIKQPRVAEKNSSKINKEKSANESNNDISITSYENQNLSASHITLSIEEKLSIGDTSEDTIVTATRESAPDHDSISSENKSNTICEEVPHSFSSHSINNSFPHQDSASREEHIQCHSENTASSMLKTMDEEKYIEKLCTLETGICKTNSKNSELVKHTHKIDASNENSSCSQISEIVEDLTVNDKSESSNRQQSVSQVKPDILNLHVNSSEIISNDGIEITSEAILTKSDPTEMNLDDDKSVNEIIDEVDGMTPSSSHTIAFDEKEDLMDENKSEIIKVFFNERVDEKTDSNFSNLDVSGKVSNILSETFVVESEKNDSISNDPLDIERNKIRNSADVLEYITNSIFAQLLNENICCSSKGKEGGVNTFYKKNEAQTDPFIRLETTEANEQTQLKSIEEVENIGKNVNSMLLKDSTKSSKATEQCLPTNIMEKKNSHETITSTFLNTFLDDATDNFLKIYHHKKGVLINHIENVPSTCNVQSSEDISTNNSSINTNKEELRSENRDFQENFVEEINVPQRVQEIMSETLHFPANSETCRLQDFMITTYDVFSAEDTSETGSPGIAAAEGDALQQDHCLQKQVELSASGGAALEGADNEGFAQDWFDEDFGLSSTRREAEELRLQQLQIEQEIQQLQQQAFLYVREIPNKPPPPYTPRGQTVSGAESSGVPTSRTEVCELASKATELVLSAVAAGADPTTLAPPAEFCTGSTVSQVFCRFLFELSCRLVAEACGDSKVCGKPWEWPDVSHRNLAVRCRSHQTIQEIVNKQIMTLFGLVPRPPIRDCLAARWKRRDHVDEMLMRESQEEEPSWTDYERDEITVKNELTEAILVDLLDDTVSVILNIFLKKSACEQS